MTLPVGLGVPLPEPGPQIQAVLAEPLIVRSGIVVGCTRAAVLQFDLLASGDTEKVDQEGLSVVDGMRHHPQTLLLRGGLNAIDRVVDQQQELVLVVSDHVGTDDVIEQLPTDRDIRIVFQVDSELWHGQRMLRGRGP